jgi:hypothetical protein
MVVLERRLLSGKFHWCEKSLDGHAKRFLWPEADLFRTAFPLNF